jgi:hypothetical protein
MNSSGGRWAWAWGDLAGLERCAAAGIEDSGILGSCGASWQQQVQRGGRCGAGHVTPGRTRIGRHGLMRPCFWERRRRFDQWL